MPPLEPTLETLAHPLPRYFAATRPPFLLAALVGGLLGVATAHLGGAALHWGAAGLALLGGVLAHAGINVLNDYYDALSGTDVRNTGRIFPFTGGSRFIQNGVMSEGQVRSFGWALMASSGTIGLMLLPQGGVALLGVGLLGMVVGWGYSAPPLALNSRGLGELSVVLGFGLVIPGGVDLVLRGGLDPLPWLAGLPYGLLVAALLYVNQFPDREADAAVGKNHWVVRLGARRGRWGYLLLVLAAYSSLLGMIGAGVLPVVAAWALVPALLSLKAAKDVLAFAEQPSRLAPAIQATIAAALLHGAVLAAVVGWS
ncbi:MAG: prenyltransferase [Alphaproteobacteria bacterium CG_4_10_14_0_2_um_filter_63_37]|nr:MAG: prenyltransferase [Alphaproteobacteria bacterium CG_4_10_14_0_2_um_filter_63_37]